MSLTLANSLACDLPDDELEAHAAFVAQVVAARRTTRELDALDGRRTWPSPDTEPAGPEPEAA
jgi:hypothetical protein